MPQAFLPNQAAENKYSIMKLAPSLILFLALSLFTWLSISEPVVGQTNKLDEQKKQLEVEKLKVEIEHMKDSDLDDQKKQAELDKLKKETEQIMIQQQQSWITLYATMGGSIIGALGLGWTIWSGLNTLNQQIQEGRQERISLLLESLSSQEEYSRLGASKGLSQYADSCVLELLTSSSIEDSDLVRQNLEDTLSLVGYQGKQQVLESNNRALLERLEIAGKIQILRASDQNLTIDINKLLLLSEPTLKKLRKAFNVQYEYGQKISRLYLENLEATPPPGIIQSYLSQNIESTASYLRKLNQITSNVIAIWLRKGIKLKWFSSGIDLSLTNLYKANLLNFRGVGCVFNYAIMRHSNLKLGMFDNCIFYDVDMYDCNLKQSYFKESDLSNSNLRKIRGIGIILDDCILINTVLSEAELTKATFQDTDIRFAKLNGAILKKSKFVQVKLNQAELRDANINQSIFDGVTLFGAKMINANLSNCQISNTQFNGADLRGVDFSKSKFKNVDFSGANLSGAKFTGAKLENVNTSHAREVNNAIGLNEAITANSIPKSWWQSLKDIFN
ncbi:pentapeptide repeat-containing protein [Nostoc parmelioides]|uniref:Pentapeptide repeat-containing protein n=1 Tax=Nostoc parmelioides FACHB-3921 TaxID=2692909 RepID=A0ABR8BMB7_9NOSO|nr:pentapeptide repeat-containing protein [Nostoc parmelioides]MBD2255257.1 pentapeptide repeat-containing protein [Nostoc parmelioides FACHB-3921]